MMPHRFDPRMLVQARRKRERLAAAELIQQQVESVSESTAKIMQGMGGSLPDPIPGPPGKDGASGSQGRDGRDGAPGRDGKDGSPGQDGKDGAPGRDGQPGKDGDPGLPGKDGDPGIPGKDGSPGKDGAPGLPGKDGSPGKDGRDGASAPPVRIEVYTGKIDASGQASISFTTPFKTIPTVLPTVITVGNQLVFPIVAGQPSLSGCKVSAKITIPTIVLNGSPVINAPIDTPITVVVIG